MAVNNARNKATPVTVSNSVKITEKKSEFEGKQFVGRAGPFRLSPFTESLKQAAEETRPWALPDECMLKILEAFEKCRHFETPPLVDIGGISREIPY